MGLGKEHFKMKLLKTMIDLKYNILNEVKNIFILQNFTYLKQLFIKKKS